MDPMHTREAAPDSPPPSPNALNAIGGSAPEAQPVTPSRAPWVDAISALPARERRLVDLLRTIFALPAGGTGLLGLSRALERAAEHAGLTELQATARTVASRLQPLVSAESDRARVRAFPDARAAHAFLYFTPADSSGDSATPIGRALAGLLLYAVEHQLPLYRYGHQLVSLLAPSKP